jgi:general stress protein 26
MTRSAAGRTVSAMKETPEEIAALQELLDRSHAAATDHLREIIDGDRRLTAADVVALLTGMRVIAVATVTAKGHPRISAMDGHFLHATWSFSTSGTAAKARHMRARPDVSVAHVDGEELALFSHGRVEELQPTDADHDETLQHWIDHYGSSPLSWGDDIRLYRYRPHWMVGYAFQRAELLTRRGLTS